MVFSQLKKVIFPLMVTGLLILFQSAFAQQVEKYSESEISLNGSVIDATNGTGIAGVIVEIDELNIKTKTNRDGAFSFTNIGLNPGEVTFHVNLNGFKELTKTIDLLQSKSITIELEPKSPIE